MSAHLSVNAPAPCLLSITSEFVDYLDRIISAAGCVKRIYRNELSARYGKPPVAVTIKTALSETNRTDGSFKVLDRLSANA